MISQDGRHSAARIREGSDSPSLFRRPNCFALLGILLLLVLTACGRGTQAALATVLPNATLVLAQASDVPTLDPASWSDPVSAIYMHALYDTLVTWNAAATEIRPDLALSWRVLDGGRLYVFTLRRGVRFANGDPLTAAAVAYNLERVTSAAAGAPYAGAYRDILGYDLWHEGRAKRLLGVTVLGPRTLSIRLAHPSAYFLDTLALMSAAIGDPVVERRYGFRAYSMHAVDTGPYQLARWIPGRELILRRNPTYFGTRPRIAKIITWLDVPPERQLFLFVQHRLDLVSLTPTTELQVLGDGRLLPLRRQGVANTLYFLGCNTTRWPLNNVLVRKAIGYAIDRPAVVATAVFGQGRVANDGLFVPTLPGYQEKAHLGPPYDPERARALLRKAHIPIGTLTLRDAFYADPLDFRIADSLKVHLEAVGIHLRFLPLDWSNFLNLLANPANPYDLYQLGWTEDYPDPQDFFDALASPKAFGSTDDTYWRSAEVHRLLSTADRLPFAREAERLTLYQEANRLILRALPLIPLYDTWSALLVNPNLRFPSLSALGLGPVLPLDFSALLRLRSPP